MMALLLRGKTPQVQGLHMPIDGSPDLLEQEYVDDYDILQYVPDTLDRLQFALFVFCFASGSLIIGTSHKVKEIMKIMERDLGIESGWLLHDRCKVYMYVNSKKVVGCAVTESISQAYQFFSKASLDVTRLPTRSKVLQMDIRQCLQPKLASNRLPSEMAASGPKSEEAVEACTIEGEKASQNSQRPLVCGERTLVFEDVKFHRERTEKQRLEGASTTAICTKKSVAAVCGIRGLWVIKSERRRGIATKVLDAVRSSFVYGLVLDASQCAFSQPTSDGMAFAAKYSETDSYLVYP
ncbi:hypothetical protein L7F22_040932 [Adiantum nelumboides]|nr:hypothetical protein [Adiantum nelumboides]